MNRIYFVDTENVGSTWKDLLPAKAKEDKIFLFFTENSPYVSYSDLQLILQYPNQFELIRCNPGKNGLDFQLVSYLGHVLCSTPNCEFIIVSNDNGFDAVVKFWKDRDYSVLRSNVYHILKTEEPPAQTEALPDTDTANAVTELPEDKPVRKRTYRKRTVSKEQSTAETEASTAATSEPAEAPVKKRRTRTKKTEAAAAAEPTEIPSEAATEPDTAVPLSATELPDIRLSAPASSGLTIIEKNAMVRKYLPSIFQDEPDSMDIITDIIFGHDTTNHHQLHLAFVKSFGDEQGTILYKAYRPHLAEYRRQMER